jgi:hypothetical protein
VFQLARRRASGCTCVTTIMAIICVIAGCRALQVLDTHVALPT